MNIAIIITSDPAAGDEAFGRAFNALALASEALRKGDTVELAFAGTGTRWPAELSKLGNPAHELYQSLRTAVVGASCGCASVFGAIDDVRAHGIPELTDNPLAGTPGLVSIHRYLADGWQTMVF